MVNVQINEGIIGAAGLGGITSLLQVAVNLAAMAGLLAVSIVWWTQEPAARQRGYGRNRNRRIPLMQYALVREIRQRVHHVGFWLVRIARPHARPTRRRYSPRDNNPRQPHHHCSPHPIRGCPSQQPAQSDPMEEDDLYADMPALETIPDSEPYEMVMDNGALHEPRAWTLDSGLAIQPNHFVRHVTYNNPVQAMIWANENRDITNQIVAIMKDGDTVRHDYSPEETLAIANLIIRSEEIRKLLDENIVRVEITPAEQA